MKKHANFKHNQTAESHSNETSGGASIENTTTASAGVEVGEECIGKSIEVVLCYCVVSFLGKQRV